MGQGPGDGRERKKSALFLLVSFVLLFISFHWNPLRIEATQREGNIVVVDNYVVPAMEIYAAGPSAMRDLGQLLVSNYGGVTRYPMQAGLQRIFYSWISPRSREGVDRALPYVRGLIEAVLALTLMAFVGVVRTELGYVSASVTALLLALSDWLIVFAPDLFWASATFFLPFTIGFLLGDPVRPRKQRWLLAALYTFFCLIKCLCGYDYTTNILGAVAVPLIYYGLRRGTPLVKIAVRIVKYAAMSVIAFCVAICLQLLQLAFVEKDLQWGLEEFRTSAHTRTLSSGEGLSSRYDQAVLSVLHRLGVAASSDSRIDVYIRPLRSLLRYFRYLGMGAFTLPLPFHSLRIPIGLFVLGFLFVFWRTRGRLRNMSFSCPAGQFGAWMWATLAALAISHLWVVAASGHMTHTFFNAIVFYIPFLPMVYALTGVGVSSAIARIAGVRRARLT